MRRSRLILPALILFGLLNAWILWSGVSFLGGDQRAAEAARRARRQEYQLAWEEHPATPILAKDFRKRLADMPRGHNLAPPLEGAAIQLDDLPEPQRSDLFDAVHDLLQAYAKNDPAAVFDAMTRRGLALDPGRIEVLRSALEAQGGRSPEEISRLSPRSLYVAIWKADGFRSSVSGLVIPSSAVSVHRVPSGLAARVSDSKSFSEWVPTVWAGIYLLAPNFGPSPGMGIADIAAAHPEILVADLEFVVDNVQGQSRLGRAPYLLRLWYNETLNRWQPLLLAAILPEGIEVGEILF